MIDQRVRTCVTFLCHDGMGRFLMAQRSDLCRDEHWRWDIGSGEIDFGEAARSAVLREIAEEYNARSVQSVDFLGYRDAIRETEEGGTHWIALDFAVQVDPDDVINLEPDKHPRLGWFTLDDLPDPLHSMLPIYLEQHAEALRSILGPRAA